MAEIKYMPLTRDQKGLYDLIGAIPVEVLNMSAAVHLLSEVDDEKIIEAMKLTVKRLSYLRIRLHKMPDGTTTQYFSDAEPEGIEIVDMSRDKDKKADEYLHKLAARSYPNKCMDCPLYCFKLIKRADGKKSLFFSALHVIVDAYALMYAVVYFDKVYSALVNGTELPAENDKAEKLIEWSYEYYASDKARKEQEWWEQQFETEPHFTSLNGKDSAEFVKGKNYGRCQNLTQFGCVSSKQRISAELVKKVNDAAIEMGVATQIYYMLALRTYLARVSGTDDVYYATTAARRATLLQKNGGMTFAHMIGCRSSINESVSFREALKTLNIVQNEAYRHAGGDLVGFERTAAEKHNTPANMQYRSAVMTYQPYLNTDRVDIKFEAEFLGAGLAAYPIYINMMPIDSTGDIWADYLYAKNYTKQESVDKFHAFMLKFVQAGIDEPDATVKELVDKCI